MDEEDDRWWKEGNHHEIDRSIQLALQKSLKYKNARQQSSSSAKAPPTKDFTFSAKSYSLNLAKPIRKAPAPPFPAAPQSPPPPPPPPLSASLSPSSASSPPALQRNQQNAQQNQYNNAGENRLAENHQKLILDRSKYSRPIEKSSEETLLAEFRSKFDLAAFKHKLRNENDRRPMQAKKEEEEEEAAQKDSTTVQQGNSVISSSYDEFIAKSTKGK